MSFPPNPSHYPDASSLDRQIMQEDWDANQARFREAPPAVIQVMCPECDTWRRETEVEVENIHEDVEGKDVLTFICPICKTQQEGFRVLRC